MYRLHTTLLLLLLTKVQLDISYFSPYIIRWVIAASIPHYIQLFASVAHIASAFPIMVALLAASVAGSD
jgi:hypothetical protein